MTTNISAAKCVKNYNLKMQSKKNIHVKIQIQRVEN